MRSLLPVERECGVGATNLLEFFFLSLSSLYLSILEVEGDGFGGRGCTIISWLLVYSDSDI